MSLLIFNANAGGAVNVLGPNVATTYNLTLPAASGTLLYQDSTNTAILTNASVSGTLTTNGTTNYTVDGIYSGTGQVWLPVGTSAQRSGSPTNGMIRYNSQNLQFEGYSNGSWIAITGTPVSGAAFGAYLSTNQSITSSTFTKVALDTVEYDTNSCFSTSNHRFTPNVAGYYQINGCVYFAGTTNTQGNAYINIYKNGSSYKQGGSLTTTAADGTGSNLVVSVVMYMNGTTDYVELWGSLQQTGPVFGGGQSLTYFNGSFVRGA